jgi:predicted AAA+ superfamily ATPase
MRVKRLRKIGRVGKGGPPNVTRADFDALIKQLNEYGEIVNELRRELQTQFIRIAQLQHQVDEIERKIKGD